jgi:hypothetical protein
MNLHRGPGLIGGVAEIFQKAIGAFGTAGDAQLPSVPDDLVSK